LIWRSREADTISSPLDSWQWERPPSVGGGRRSEKSRRGNGNGAGILGRVLRGVDSRPGIAHPHPLGCWTGRTRSGRQCGLRR